MAHRRIVITDLGTGTRALFVRRRAGHPMRAHPQPVQYGWWIRLWFGFCLACGLWVEPRVVWLARVLGLY